MDFAVARGKGEQGGNAEGKVSGFHTALRDVGNKSDIGILLYFRVLIQFASGKGSFRIGKPLQTA